MQLICNNVTGNVSRVELMIPVVVVDDDDDVNETEKNYTLPTCGGVGR